MAMLMGLSLLVYSIGQRQLRNNLKENNTGVKNNTGKITDRPTLRWIFQGFQGIHVMVFNGVKPIVNLTDCRQHTILNFPEGCQKYYILSGEFLGVVFEFFNSKKIEVKYFIVHLFSINKIIENSLSSLAEILCLRYC